MDESSKRVIAIVAGILVEKQLLEEDFRQNRISPRAQFAAATKGRPRGRG
jgi:hypothetical protein